MTDIQTVRFEGLWKLVNENGEPEDFETLRAVEAVVTAAWEMDPKRRTLKLQDALAALDPTSYSVTDRAAEIGVAEHDANMPRGPSPADRDPTEAPEEWYPGTGRERLREQVRYAERFVREFPAGTTP